MRTDYEYRLLCSIHKSPTVFTNSTIFIDTSIFVAEIILYISNAKNKSRPRKRFFQLTLNLCFSVTPFALN